MCQKLQHTFLSSGIVTSYTTRNSLYRPKSMPKYTKALMTRRMPRLYMIAFYVRLGFSIRYNRLMTASLGSMKAIMPGKNPAIV